MTLSDHKGKQITRNTTQKSILQDFLTLFVVIVLAEVTGVHIYYEGPAAGIGFAMDDVSMMAESCMCPPPVAGAGTELLQNGGFESQLNGWVCSGFNCARSSSQKTSGSYGVVVSQRSDAELID
jgi:hypothetical protein